jgi:hypothetical protein
VGSARAKVRSQGGTRSCSLPLLLPRASQPYCGTCSDPSHVTTVRILPERPVKALAMAQDAPPAFVDAIDDATVFSRAAGGATSAELTMSWAGQSFAATGGALGEGELPPECAPTCRSLHRCDAHAVRHRYSQARAPTRPLQYTFTPHTSGSMLLIPPAEAPDSRAVYYITVFPNLFNPGTGVTRVLRGGGADGSFVGEFECVPCVSRAYPLTQPATDGDSRARISRSQSGAFSSSSAACFSPRELGVTRCVVTRLRPSSAARA